MSENEQEETKESDVESQEETKESDVESQEETKESDVESKEEAKEQAVESRKMPSRARRDPSVVYVGNKPPMNYVMAVITAFNMGNGTEVTLKARGRAISTAVDVVEITRNRFLKEAKVHAISIGTEEITPREGGNPRNVSTIEINLKK